MNSIRFLLPLTLFASMNPSLLAGAGQSPGQELPQPSAPSILNVSYDATRDLFQDINPGFIEYLKQSKNLDIKIEQSHAGSGKQAQAVVDGLKADVVTLALAPDVDLLVQNHLVAEDWRQKFAYNAAPYTSTIVFVVRQGNPKGVKDWSDLIRSDVELVTPNPKTSGGARWSYLAAWGYGLQASGQEESGAQSFVQQLYSRVVAFDSGARGSTISFAEKKLGDVLITWENEAYQILNSYPKAEFEIVLPSVSIQAEPVVALVDQVVDAKGTREVATAYLNYLYSDEAQEIIAQNHFRPRNEKILKKYEQDLKPIPTFTIENPFQGWNEVQKVHFNEGGKLDQILSEVGLK